METAFVFPGMGPTRFADAARFMVANAHARRLFRRADEVLGYSVFDRFADTEDDYDESAQVAFLVSCLALADWAVEELGIRPDVCTGPSFGQKTVTGFSQSLSFEDTVLLTARIARALVTYFATEHTDVVTQSFVRVPPDKLDPILAELTEQGEWHDFAGYLDSTFFMVNLREHRLDWFTERLRAVGGLPLYAMRPPMHSALFGPLRDMVDTEILSRFTFTDPRVPIVCDQTGGVLTTAREVRTMLLDGLVRPVRWPDVAVTLASRSVSRVVVSGQDSMFGRVDCVAKNFEVLAVNPRLAMQPRRRVHQLVGAAR